MKHFLFVAVVTALTAPALAGVVFMGIILKTAVGRGGVCGYGGAGQGATRRNGRSIATSCNAARRRQNRAIRPVATSHQMGGRQIYEAVN